jgi:hypothetical protein
VKHTGIFGLFDILGFKTFSENSDLNQSRKVLEWLDSLDEIFKAQFLNMYQTHLGEFETLSFLNEFHWLIFSDTIFFALPFRDNPNSETERTKLFFFILISAIVNRRMFEIGFPLRGIIHTGEFVVTKKCFAGKPVMDAFKRVQDMKIAACAFSSEATAYINNNIPSSHPAGMFLPALMVEFPIPNQSGQVEKLHTINWLSLFYPGRINPNLENVHGFVANQFQAPGKQIENEDVQKKLKNTQELLVHWLSVQPKMKQKWEDHPKFTGSISTASVTSSGSASD